MKMLIVRFNMFFWHDTTLQTDLSWWTDILHLTYSLSFSNIHCLACYLALSLTPSLQNMYFLFLFFSLIPFPDIILYYSLSLSLNIYYFQSFSANEIHVLLIPVFPTCMPAFCVCFSIMQFYVLYLLLSLSHKLFL